ncbi:hypothetical protein [Roseovarius sp. EL26]|uniref:hypothetical protein n=1 Tax=Roseovarius sp. EL26 TaxID=2126672 RepID=UPI000EA1D0C9|nr:hypothetical protein [Roseovarius sp. EL26]
MNVVIYLLLIVVAAGFATTFVRLFMFFGSFSSLIFTSQETGRDKPRVDVLTYAYVFASVWYTIQQNSIVDAISLMEGNLLTIFAGLYSQEMGKICA